MPKSRRRSSRAKVRSCLIEVGDVGEGGGQAQLLRRAQARADRVLDLAQAAGEGELLRVVDLLVVEHQHGVPVHPGVDGRDVLGGQRLGHVDALDFGGEARADLAGADGHGGGLLSRLVSRFCRPAGVPESPCRARNAIDCCPPGSLPLREGNMRHFLWPLGVAVAFGAGLAAASLYPGMHSTAPPAEDAQAIGPPPADAGQHAAGAAARQRDQIRRSSRGDHGTGHRIPDEPRQASSIEGSGRPGCAAGDEAAPRRASPRTTSARRRASPRRRQPARPRSMGRSTASTAISGTASGATGPARWRQLRELVADFKAMGDAGTQALARVLASGDQQRGAANRSASSWARCRTRGPCHSCRTSWTGTATSCSAAPRAGALRRLESPDTIPVLNTLLANPTDDRFVRMSAAYGLAQMGQPQGVNGLMQIFDEANADGRGRDMAFRALNSLNDERSLPFMRQVAASGGELSYRLQAIKFLTAQGRPAVAAGAPADHPVTHRAAVDPRRRHPGLRGHHPQTGDRSP